MKERTKEESTASRGEVCVASESSEKNEEAQENMGQQSSSLLLSDKRSEDTKEIEAGEILGPHTSKLRYEDSREKKLKR